MAGTSPAMTAGIIQPYREMLEGKEQAAEREHHNGRMTITVKRRDAVSPPGPGLHPRVTAGEKMYPPLRTVRIIEGFFGSSSSLWRSRLTWTSMLRS
jgi:hypothetical protein